MSNVVRTASGAALQSASLTKRPLQILAHSTLNEKLDILNGVMYSNGVLPSIAYFTIGNKGHTSTIGADNISITTPKYHKARHTGLYNMLPFVMRTLDNDLTPSEAAKYRLRRIETHGGVQYACYYLMVIDYGDVGVEQELRTNTNGVITAVPHVPTLEDLNPTPPIIGDGSVINANGDKIAATTKIPFSLTIDDVTEIRNVCEIIYQSTDYAFITELGVCSGVDKLTTGNFNGVSLSYTEAICVQITDFIATQIPLAFKDSVDMIFDIGSTEPLPAE